MATQSQVKGAYASPRCPTAACRGAQMAHIGEGTSPFAAPPPPAAVAAAAGLPAVPVTIYTGRDTDRGRDIDWVVTENSAQMQIAVTMTVNGNAFARPALMHSSMLVRHGVLEEDWAICPPFNQPGQPPACWFHLARNSDALQRIGRFSTISGVTPPLVFDVRLTLGNARFGLIHLLAGHTNVLRSGIGIQNQAQDTADEGYRTIQGLQQSIMDSFKLSALREIRHGGGGKWLFYGADGALLVTDGVRGGPLSITTFYIKGPSPKNSDKLYWKRR